MTHGIDTDFLVAAEIRDHLFRVVAGLLGSTAGTVKLAGTSLGTMKADERGCSMHPTAINSKTSGTGFMTAHPSFCKLPRSTI
jgi:hypothetical protein